MTLSVVIDGTSALIVYQDDGETETTVVEGESETQTEEGETEEHAEEGDPPNPVLPTGNELVFAAITFFALWALMKFVCLPPILRLRQERNDKIRADLDAAERAREAVSQTRSEYQLALVGARGEANALIDAARGEAEGHRGQLQSAADDDISRLRSDAQNEIDSARTAALIGLQGDVSALAVEAASLVVQKPVDAAAAQSVIDQAMEENR